MRKEHGFYVPDKKPEDSTVTEEVVTNTEDSTVTEEVVTNTVDSTVTEEVVTNTEDSTVTEEVVTNTVDSTVTEEVVTNTVEENSEIEEANTVIEEEETNTEEEPEPKKDSYIIEKILETVRTLKDFTIEDFDIAEASDTDADPVLIEAIFNINNLIHWYNMKEKK